MRSPCDPPEVRSLPPGRRLCAENVSAASTAILAAVLADDLTGATDSGAPFANRGLTVRVADDPGLFQQPSAHVVSCALDTRGLPLNAAMRRLRAAVEPIPRPAPDILFCKIDSCGRGHIGETISSILATLGCDWALVTPAFPAQGRRVKNGILYVSTLDHDGREACVAVPLKPLFSTPLQTALALIPNTDARTQAQDISAALSRGQRILLCDAETQEDMSSLVNTARQLGRGRILWCGSAAMARALADLHFPLQSSAPRAFHAGRICLVFAGTPHPVTGHQMETLAAADGTLHIDSSSLPADMPAVSRCLAVRVRCGETSAAFIRKIWNLAQSSGGVSGLVVTGGDTGTMVLRALEAQSILVRGEIAAGIPWGILEGGAADGYRIVTKSGGFGTRSTLVDAVNFLESGA